MTATVLHGINNLFTLEDDSGGRWLASIKGKVLRGLEGSYNCLAPGDRVEAEPDPHGGGRARILSLHPRRNLYARWNEKGRSPQSLAANIDRVILLATPSHPPFRPRFIDRVMVSCADQGLELHLVMNKCDLGLDDSVEERIDDYRRLGLPILLASVRTGRGVADVARLIGKGVSVFTGQSGVGKSSLLNALHPGLGLKVGELCAKWERGAHTTILSAMFSLPSGARVVDTPGFRRFALSGIQPERLASLFPDMAAAALQCAYGPSCAHEGEDGCAVIEAVEAGALHPDRYESYLRIREELEGRIGETDTASRTRAAGRGRAGRAASRPRPKEADFMEEGE